MIRYEIRPDAHLVRYEVDDAFDLAEFRDVMGTVLRQPTFDSSMHSLWIMGPRTVSKLPTEDVFALAGDIDQLGKRRGTPWKIAIVLCTAVDMGMSRMLQTAADGALGEIGLFEREGDALAWLSPP